MRIIHPSSLSRLLIFVCKKLPCYVVGSLILITLKQRKLNMTQDLSKNKSNAIAFYKMAYEGNPREAVET